MLPARSTRAVLPLICVLVEPQLHVRVQPLLAMTLLDRVAAEQGAHLAPAVLAAGQ